MLQQGCKPQDQRTIPHVRQSPEPESMLEWTFLLWYCWTYWSKVFKYQIVLGQAFDILRMLLVLGDRMPGIQTINKWRKWHLCKIWNSRNKPFLFNLHKETWQNCSLLKWCQKIVTQDVTYSLDLFSQVLVLTSKEGHSIQKFNSSPVQILFTFKSSTRP